jgi:hypothetical protein
VDELFELLGNHIEAFPPGDVFDSGHEVGRFFFGVFDALLNVGGGETYFVKVFYGADLSLKIASTRKYDGATITDRNPSYLLIIEMKSLSRKPYPEEHDQNHVFISTGTETIFLTVV